jgi:hypothetical protein
MSAKCEGHDSKKACQQDVAASGEATREERSTHEIYRHHEPPPPPVRQTSAPWNPPLGVALDCLFCSLGCQKLKLCALVRCFAIAGQARKLARQVRHRGRCGVAKIVL